MYFITKTPSILSKGMCCSVKWINFSKQTSEFSHCVCVCVTVLDFDYSHGTLFSIRGSLAAWKCEWRTRWKEAPSVNYSGTLNVRKCAAQLYSISLSISADQGTQITSRSLGSICLGFHCFSLAHKKKKKNQRGSFITSEMNIFVWTFPMVFHGTAKPRSQIYQKCAGSRCSSHGICLLKKHYSVPLIFPVHLTCTNHTLMHTHTHTCE